MVKILLGDEDRKLGHAMKEYFSNDRSIEFLGQITESNLLIDSITRLQPDIILLDFMRDSLRGLSLAKQVTMELQQSKVIVISNTGNDELVMDLSEIGVTYYLMKPFSMPVLQQTINWIQSISSNTNVLNAIYIRERQQIRHKLCEYFTAIGIPAHFKGYHYLLDAIILVSQDSTWLNGITKRLYPAIAVGNKTTASQVERSIRYAIDTAWVKGDLDIIESLFPYAIDPAKGKPTNSAFIAKMADIINLGLSS